MEVGIPSGAENFEVRLYPSNLASNQDTLSYIFRFQFVLNYNEQVQNCMIISIFLYPFYSTIRKQSAVCLQIHMKL